jgi:hypothetical protein
MRTHSPAASRTALAVAAAALLLGACADGGGRPRPPAPRAAYTTHGLTVRLPAGWQHATRSLTPHLIDPLEVLAVATYPLRYRRTRCAHVAGSALEDLGPTDAFVTLQERARGAGFPPRPARFGPRLGGPSAVRGCVPGSVFSDHWFTFSDAGRRFHVDVAFGPRTSSATRRQAWGVLDGLHVDRSYSRP